MKQKLLSICFLSFSCINILNAQIVWNGPTISFSKAAFANHLLPANQDRITASTWITRANTRGIFNIFSEGSYIDNVSPANTRWATGSLSNYASLTYQPWEIWAGGPPNIPNIVGISAVLHLIAENIYIGINFTSWGVGTTGGGSFSYQRTTAPITTPVTLVNFSATKKNNALQLNWKTASEESTSFFSVERSEDGKQFSSIGTITAAGNSMVEKNYSFTDANPLPSNFYRLKTTDLNGSFSYSHIVAFKMKKSKAMEIFPVPATSVLNVQVNVAQQTMLQVIDVVGRTLRSITISPGDNAFVVDISSLKAGVYFLKTAEDSKLFIKE